MSHTPVTILTGFLGSGKTTLLNRALRDPSMARTAVVINEFGEIGLDQVLAAQSDDTIMVLENGCLCCTVFGDLVTTLNNLYHAREAGEIPRFDHMVIETSGLADPAPLIQAFLSDPTLAGLYRIGIVVATVDAVNGPHTLDEHIESVRQVALADHILITKLDLVPDPSPPPQAGPHPSPPRQAGEGREGSRKTPKRRSPHGCIVSTRRQRSRASTIPPSPSAVCYAGKGSTPAMPKPTHAPGSTPPPTSTSTSTITRITIMTTTIITICTTATLPRSASSATNRSRAKRCGCCSTPCSRISDRTSCG